MRSKGVMPTTKRVEHKSPTASMRQRHRAVAAWPLTREWAGFLRAGGRTIDTTMVVAGAVCTRAECMAAGRATGARAQGQHGKPPLADPTRAPTTSCDCAGANHLAMPTITLRPQLGIGDVAYNRPSIRPLALSQEPSILRYIVKDARILRGYVILDLRHQAPAAVGEREPQLGSASISASSLRGICNQKPSSTKNGVSVAETKSAISTRAASVGRPQPQLPRTMLTPGGAELHADIERRECYRQRRGGHYHCGRGQNRSAARRHSRDRAAHREYSDAHSGFAAHVLAHLADTEAPRCGAKIKGAGHDPVGLGITMQEIARDQRQEFRLRCLSKFLERQHRENNGRVAPRKASWVERFKREIAHCRLVAARPGRALRCNRHNKFFGV